MRRKLLSILGGLISLPLLAQYQQIGGVVNSYYPVDAVNITSVQCSPAGIVSTLAPGDKVVLMQMSGVLVDDSPGAENRTLQGLGPENAGQYELLAVKEVNDGSGIVTFTDTLGTYTNTEKIQLIKIHESEYAEVTSSLEATPWNGSVGGVVALVVFKKLKLGDSINVSGQGYWGGTVEGGYTNDCAVSSVLNVDGSTSNEAGNKGESNVKISCSYTKGPGLLVTGGGGGYGRFSGGGGGGNYGAGGTGGQQASGCSNVTKAQGGRMFSNFFTSERVCMGGGGGSSTEEDIDHPATPGGNGGGLVIILADTLEANGNAIYADGQSVTDVAHAGAGGGGAGGSVLLEVNHFADELNVYVRGGNGGNTNDFYTSTGAGGGGGGGLVMYSGATVPNNLDIDSTGGTRGVGIQSGNNGTNGEVGGSLPNLELPLNGFLFNTLNGIDTICAGQRPDTIIGSVPRGGEYAYIYTWIQSLDDDAWSVAIGEGDSTHFKPAALGTTTYFARVVQSGDVSDTSISVKVFVYDAITGNDLTLRDTLCYNESPGLLNTVDVHGGDEEFTYRWQSKEEDASWQERGTAPTLNEGMLTLSTSYRRIVSSVEVCVDTSNVDTVTILPLITNNEFPVDYLDTAVCAGLDAGSVRLSFPGGGEVGSYSYQWLQSAANDIYSPIALATNQNYAPGTPGSSNYFKRIVRSGEGNACMDTSNAFFLEVYQPITGNAIQTDSSRYCWGDVPELISGDLPGGGDLTSYDYRWVERLPGGTWSILGGEIGINYIPATSYVDTVEIRRVVESGRYAACIDSSNIIQLDVIPQTFNALISSDTSVCQNAAPLPFGENAASGANGGFSYLWQQQVIDEGTWGNALALPNTAIDYASDELTSSTRFRRAAISEICTTYSNTIEVTVYPTLENNDILGGTLQYTCFNTSIALSTPTLVGGKPDETPRYIWQQSDDASGWFTAEGIANAFDYTSPALEDTIYYQRIVYSGENDQCIDTSETVLVRINPLPQGDIINGIDTACSDGVISVAYSNLQGNQPWVLVLGTSEEDAFQTAGIIQAEGTIEYPVGTSGDVHVLDLVDDSACHADLSQMSGTVELKVYDYPQVNAGADDEQCGMQYTLQAISAGEIGSWQGDYTYSDRVIANSQVEVETYTESISHEFIWKEWNWNCGITDTVSIQFYEQPEQPDLGEDITLDNIFKYQMEASDPIGEGLWSVTGPGSVTFADDDSSRHDAFLVFEPFITGSYQFIWTVSNGVCVVLDDTLIVTIDEVELYDGFSPNGDDINDEYIINLSGEVRATLTILDRWGNIVYVTTGEDQLIWDGFSDQNKEMPVGAYAYILTRPGLPAKKGFIELRR